MTQQSLPLTDKSQSACGCGCTDEGIPALDMLKTVALVGEAGARLVGANCPGLPIPPPICSVCMRRLGLRAAPMVALASGVNTAAIIVIPVNRQASAKVIL